MVNTYHFCAFEYIVHINYMVVDYEATLAKKEEDLEWAKEIA